MFSHSGCEDIWMVWLIRRNIVKSVTVNWFGSLDCCYWWWSWDISIVNMSSGSSPTPTSIAPDINSVWNKNMIIQSMFLYQSSGISEVERSLMDLTSEWFWVSSIFSVISNNINDIFDHVDFIRAIQWSLVIIAFKEFFRIV